MTVNIYKNISEYNPVVLVAAKTEDTQLEDEIILTM